MLKIIPRLALLLALCLLIAGGVYALVSANPGLVSAAGAGEEFEGRGFAAGEGPRARPAGADLTARPESGNRFPGGDHRGGSAAGWLGILKNLGIVAALVLVVAGLRWLFRRAKGLSFFNRRQSP